MAIPVPRYQGAVNLPAPGIRLAERISMGHRLWRWSLLTLLYAAFATLCTWPLGAQLGTAVVSPIDAVDSTWRIGHAQEKLLRGDWRLFDTDLFHPYPNAYLFDELIIGAALLTLPLRVVTSNPLIIYNLAVLLTFVLNALAMYALARHLGCIRVAAFAAGLIYAFAPLRFDQLDHVGLLSAQYFPLIILLLDRLFSAPRRRDAIFLAVTLTLQALSSQYYALYLPLICGGFVALRLIQGVLRRQRFPWQTWAGLGLAGLAAGLAILPFALGYLAVRGQHQFTRSIESNIRYSANLASFITAGEWNLIWGPLTAPLRALGPYSIERDLLIGVCACLLALVGVWATWRRPLTQYLLLLGGGAAVLALGPALYATDSPGSRLFGPLPYHYLYDYLPLFDAMRVPARLGILYALSVAGLAALGVHWLLGRLTRDAAMAHRGADKRYWAVALLLLGGIVLESLNRPRDLAPLESGSAIPPVYRWLNEQPQGVVIQMPLQAKRDQYNNRVQYFSLYHRHDLINGSADIVPTGYRSLAEELYRGLSPRSLGILQGLGVTYIVIDYDLVHPDAADKSRRLLESNPTLTRKVAEFGNEVVYQLGPTDRYDRLRAAIPREATIYLAQDVHFETYLGMLGWVLRDNQLYARVPTSFGQRIVGPPQPGVAYDYAILHRRTDPATVGFAGAAIVWEDETARAYRRVTPERKP